MTVLKNIAVTRGSEAVVKAECLAFRPGDCSVIVGASGSGKTSLLMAISGVGREAGLKFHADIAFANGDFCTFDDLQRPFCSLVLQTSALYDDLTVQENLDIVTASMTGTCDIDREIMYRLLDGIDASAMPNTLSGGQQQRVAIVRSLLNGSRVCLMDEPNAGLDPRRSQDLLDLIDSLCAVGMHVVITTHHPRIFLDKSMSFYFLKKGILSTVDEGEKGIAWELARLSDQTANKNVKALPVSLEGKRKKNWLWEFFVRDLWSHFLSPTTLLYVGTACGLISFTLGYVSVARYPFSQIILDATLERIAAELGDGFYRFSIPLIVGILIAARSSSLATSDLLQKQLNGSTLALAQIQVPIRRYRSLGLLFAITISSICLFIFAIVISLYMLGSAITLATNMPLGLVMAFVVEDIFRGAYHPSNWTWVFAKMFFSGLSVAAISLLVCQKIVRSGQQIRNLGALAIFLSVLAVTIIQSALILLEMKQ